MLKYILIPVWCSLLTMVGFVVPGLLQTPTDAPAEKHVALTEMQTDTLSIAVVRNGTVKGHVATRVIYHVPSDIADSDLIPLHIIVEDALTDVLSTFPIKKITEIKKQQMAPLRDALETKLQSSGEHDYIKNVELKYTRLLLK